MDRLEAEVTRGRKEVEQEFTERIRRLREKYEGELEVGQKNFNENELHRGPRFVTITFTLLCYLGCISRN